MNLESRVLKLEECYYELEDTPSQYYDLDAEMANHFNWDLSSLYQSLTSNQS